MSDGVFGTCFNTIAAKDAAPIVDVVNLGVSFVDADPFSSGTGIVFGNDVDTL